MMKNILLRLLPMFLTICVMTNLTAQPTMDVTIENTGSNTIRIKGTANGAFTGPATGWNMLITIRIPKTAITANFPLNSEYGNPSSVISSETTNFTGADPVDVLTGSTNLGIFDSQDCGATTDNGYWYIQIGDGPSAAPQAFASGDMVTIFEMAFPTTGWSCGGCVEIMTSDDPVLASECSISTTSHITNTIHGDVLNITTNNAPLPIELITFETRTDKCDLNLYWETASERNLGYFDIEVSKDGRNFLAVERIKPASANSAARRTYQYAISPQLNGQYFRLKAVAVDGAFKYSPVVFAKAPCPEKRFDAILYPNPNYTSELMVEIYSPKVIDNVQLHLLDAFGKVIRIQRIEQLLEGANKLPIDTDQLPAGAYYIRIIGIPQLNEPLKFIRSSF